MHWKSGFSKQSHYHDVHTDEDCGNHMQGEKCKYGRCRDMHGQTGPNRDRQGQTKTDRDRQVQAGKSPPFLNQMIGSKSTVI